MLLDRCLEQMAIYGFTNILYGIAAAGAIITIGAVASFLCQQEQLQQ